MLQFMGLQRVAHDLLAEQQSFYDFHPIPGQCSHLSIKESKLVFK